MSATAVVSIVGGALVNAMNKPSSSAGDAAARAADAQAAISQDQWNYYKQNFQPLESSLIQQAQTAGSPEEIAAAEGRASADVTGAYNQAGKTAANKMQTYGINPGSPAYVSGVESAGLAEGSTKAGAITNAYNQQKQLAYSKMLDVVGLGRNIPAQSAASAAGSAQSAGIMQNSLNSQFLQNNQNMQNAGYGIGQLYGAARSYFGNSNPSPAQSAANNSNMNDINSGGNATNPYGPGGFTGAKGGLLTETGFKRYAEGGNVTEENDNITDQRMDGGGQPMPVGLEPALLKKGFHPAMAKMASKGVITPHMRNQIHATRFQKLASGGGVGSQGIEPSKGVSPPAQSNQVLSGPGTETSDSIPAQVDGKEPAALSKGEFVMSAEVPRLTGEEILQAINNAGLEKRNQQSSATVDPNAGSTAYNCGGKVRV